MTTHPVRPWVTCSGKPCICEKPKSLAPNPSPYEQREIDRFGIYEQEE